MSRIRGKDTRPEIAVRSVLHRLGLRFRKHGLFRNERLPGRPDVVMAARRTVVVVHGCFWHRHRGCSAAYTPKSNLPFWLAKFEGNVARDRRNAVVLRRLGWRVITVWECETSDHQKLARMLKKRLRVSQLSP
jgi:DNA mismatch endonuclease, patch repair protein